MFSFSVSTMVSSAHLPIFPLQYRASLAGIVLSALLVFRICKIQEASAIFVVILKKQQKCILFRAVSAKPFQINHIKEILVWLRYFTLVNNGHMVPWCHERVRKGGLWKVCGRCWIVLGSHGKVLDGLRKVFDGLAKVSYGLGKVSDVF